MESQREGHHLPPGIEGEGKECTCLCCGTLFHGNFCPNCGQSSRIRRLTLSDTLNHTFSSFTSLDSRLVHTVRDLFTRPGYMVWDYIKGCRTEYFPPIQMLFSLATVYVLLSFVITLDPDMQMSEDLSIVTPEKDDYSVLFARLIEGFKSLMQRIHSNKATSALLTNMLLLFPMKWCYRKTERGRQLNLIEYFFILTFIGCQSLILALVLAPLFAIFGIDTSELHTLAMALMYLWLSHQLFQISWWKCVRFGIYVLFLMVVQIIALFFIVVFIVICLKEAGALNWLIDS